MLWEFESKSQHIGDDDRPAVVVYIGMLWEFESKSQQRQQHTLPPKVVYIGMLWEFESKSQHWRWVESWVFRCIYRYALGI